MQVFQVPFCGGIGYALRSDDDKAALLQDLRASFGIRAMDGGTGIKYRATVHAAEIRKRGGTCALRPRGTPHLLAMTRAPATLSSSSPTGGNGICAFVDRRIGDGHFYPKVILVRFEFVDERVFDGTVLDGVMVRLLGDRWVFVVGDVLACRGRDLRGVAGWERRRLLCELLSPSQHRPDCTSDVCFLRVRPEFPIAALRSLRRTMASEEWRPDYELSGVVFRDPQARLGCPGEEDVIFPIHSSGPPPPSKQPPGRLCAPSRSGGDEYEEDCLDDDEEDDEDEDEDEGHPLPPDTPRAEFYVRRTNLPDVFELYGTAEEALHGPTDPGHAGIAPIAGVPTIRASTALREASAERPLRPVMFELAQRFGKWTPVFGC